MRIAIPTTGDCLNPHFGHCEKFVIVDVDPKTKEVIATTEALAPEHRPGLLPVWLKERGVTVVIAGGMGARALSLFHEASIEAGIGKRFEVGYTHEYHNLGGDASLSPLWQNGFEIFNAKVIVVPENYKKNNWIPAISTGFIARTGVRNVGDYLTWHAATNAGSSNGDIYAVATKVVTQTKKVPLVLSFGVRGTNSSLWGLGGNAPDFTARAFGALGFVFTGPGKSTIILASEAAQQPKTIKSTAANGSTAANFDIPTSIDYAVRIVPSPKRKLNLDFGVLQAAGRIAPGVDLQARARFAFGISYGL